MENIKDFIKRLQGLQLLALENGLNFEVRTRDADSKPWIVYCVAEESASIYDNERCRCSTISYYDWQSDEANTERINREIDDIEEFVRSYPDKFPMWYRKLIRKTDPEDDTLELCSPLFGDDECHEIPFIFYDGHAEGNGIRMTYPKLADLTIDKVREVDLHNGAVIDSGVLTNRDVCLKYGEIEFIGIMDTSNGHDKSLVDRINVKWAEWKEKFRPILIALYERDLNEIFNADSFAYDTWTSKEIALEDLRTDWDKHAPNYLQHIADDGDLSAILNFVR